MSNKPTSANPGIFKRWDISEQELDEVVASNPSLRGMMLGYISELKLRKLFASDPRISRVWKEDDHDRTKKGDAWITVDGVDISFEVKSLQTNSVRETAGGFKGTFQCDASDRRPVRFPNGITVETTCLEVGEFDILAVGLFEFGQQWRFGFAKNSDLPRTTSKKYPEDVRAFLLKSSMPITWPLQPPYEDEPFRLIAEIAALKREGRSVEPVADVGQPLRDEDEEQ